MIKGDSIVENLYNNLTTNLYFLISVLFVVKHKRTYRVSGVVNSGYCDTINTKYGL